MSIKTQFAPNDGKLLGAQIVGYTGVDKRIDLFASIIKFNGTIYDLVQIEHAYAPPYSSAKDPVNIAGFVAENILNEKTKLFSWRDVQSIDFSKSILIDVRTKEEYDLGTIEEALNIPLDDIRDRISEIPKDKKVMVFCGVGLRGYVATRILMQHGYKEVFNLNGGYKTYEFAIQKQSNDDIYDKDMIGKDDQIYQTGNSSKITTESLTSKVSIDACGLQCPGPIMKLKKNADDAKPGQVFEIKATDPSFAADIKAWANMTGNKLQEVKESAGVITAILEKQHSSPGQNEACNLPADGKSLIVFSDDLDKAIASFIIANGAASTGKKVAIFFTFWGLNVIKKPKKPKVKKDILGKMFGMMMPASSKNLKLSKMNMMGLGTIMIRKVMKKKNIDTLESLIEQAHQNGVEFIACTMSMDVMGVKKEELYDFVNFGGVATYMEKADKSNVNLFI